MIYPRQRDTVFTHLSTLCIYKRTPTNPFVLASSWIPVPEEFEVVLICILFRSPTMLPNHHVVHSAWIFRPLFGWHGVTFNMNPEINNAISCYKLCYWPILTCKLLKEIYYTETTRTKERINIPTSRISQSLLGIIVCIGLYQWSNYQNI